MKIPIFFRNRHINLVKIWKLLDNLQKCMKIFLKSIAWINVFYQFLFWFIELKITYQNEQLSFMTYSTGGIYRSLFSDISTYASLPLFISETNLEFIFWKRKTAEKIIKNFIWSLLQIKKKVCQLHDKLVVLRMTNFCDFSWKTLLTKTNP